MSSVLHVSWRRLGNSDGADLMLRLALVVNDLSNSDTLRKVIRNKEDKKNTNGGDRILRDILNDIDLRNGLRLYAFRMQIGHLREGLKVIREIRKNEEKFSRFLTKLQPETLQKYELLKQMFDDKPTEGKYEKFIKALRDSVGFHYISDGKGKGTDGITKSLHKMADTNVASVNSIIHGRDIHNSRFVLADGAVIHAICGFLWEVTKENPADTEEAIDKACEWCATQANALYGFGRDLCTVYFSEYNAL